MPSILDKLRGVLRRTENTTTDLRVALDDAHRAETDAVAAVERQVVAVAANYLDPDVKREKDRAELERLRLAAGDAAAIRGELERRHAAALDGEEQARRSAIYADARRKADDAALALARTYPQLAAGLTSMLRDLAVAQAAVVEANAQLPVGAEPIIDPELSARSIPGLPREIVSDTEIEAWGRFDLDVPVDEQFQSEIYPVGRGWGKRGAYEMGTASQGEPQAAYRRRVFRKLVTREPTNGEWSAPLASQIYLPAARGAGALWGNAYVDRTDLTVMNDRGGADPSAVLARLAELDRAAVAKPAKVERTLRTEYVSHRDVEPLPDPVPLEQRAGQPSGTGSRFGASPFARPGARAGGRR